MKGTHAAWLEGGVHASIVSECACGSGFYNAAATTLHLRILFQVYR